MASVAGSAWLHADRLTFCAQASPRPVVVSCRIGLTVDIFPQSRISTAVVVVVFANLGAASMFDWMLELRCGEIRLALLPNARVGWAARRR